MKTVDSEVWELSGDRDRNLRKQKCVHSEAALRDTTSVNMFVILVNRLRVCSGNMDLPGFNVLNPSVVSFNLTWQHTQKRGCVRSTG